MIRYSLTDLVDNHSYDISGLFNKDNPATAVVIGNNPRKAPDLISIRLDSFKGGRILMKDHMCLLLRCNSNGLGEICLKATSLLGASVVCGGNVLRVNAQPEYREDYSGKSINDFLGELLQPLDRIYPIALSTDGPRGYIVPLVFNVTGD